MTNTLAAKFSLSVPISNSGTRFSTVVTFSAETTKDLEANKTEAEQYAEMYEIVKAQVLLQIKNYAESKA